MIIHNPKISGSIQFPADAEGNSVTLQVNNGKFETIQLDSSNNPTAVKPESNLSGSFTGSFLGDGSGLTGVSAINIDALDSLGGATVAQEDNLVISDAGTEKKVTFSNLEDSIFGNISGNAIIAAGGAVTIDSSFLNTSLNAATGSYLTTVDISTNTNLAVSDTSEVHMILTGDTLSAELIGGVVSGSSQVNADSITNFDTNVKDKLNTEGVISGSSQITITESQISDLVHYTDSDVKTKLNTEGVVSGSSQITITESQISDLVHYTDSDVKAKLDAETVISGSSQITITESQISDLVHYTDSDVKAKLDAETVISGSSQVSISSSQISDVDAFSQSGTYASLRAQSTTKADVGLGSVDNTTDAGKPVSTAGQTALNLKANLASPTFTGTPIIDTLRVNSGGAIRMYNAAGNGYTDTSFNESADKIQLNRGLIPSADGYWDIGTPTKRVGTVFAQTFTGAIASTTTATTQADNDNSTKIATTAYVQREVSDLLGGAPAAFDTLLEISASIANGDSDVVALTTTVGTKLAKASNLSDLADAGTARTNLGVDAAGTDNSTDVTVTGSLDYITLSGQVLTLGSITNDDLAGSIANAKLANSAITIDGVSTSLGGSVTTLQLGSTVSTALAGNTTTISGAQASAITANTAKETNVTTNLSITGTTGARTIVSSDGTDAIIPIATTSVSGVMSTTLFDKLNGIETSADVTDATNVEAAGALMDSELTDLAGVKGVTISTLQVKPSEGAFANGDKTKLDAIEASATADQTAAEIRALVGTGNSNFVPAAGTAGHFLKHDGTFGLPSYTVNTNTTYSVGDGGLTQVNFTTADNTKLDGIEAGAEVNVVDSVAGKTGVVTLVKGDVGLANVDNTADSAKPVSTAGQTALNLKANLASPTFTGTVGGVTATHVGLGNVTNESKATMFSSPTFTGTVAGVSATHVGLGNVTNTSDANKPVSTAQQTALNLKANLASPTFTGVPLSTTPASNDSSTKIATTAYVQGEITDLIGGAGAAFDTLLEISASIANGDSDVVALTTTVGGKLTKADNLSDLTDTGTARTNLGLGSLATLSTVNAATITDNSVGAAELNVTGNGTATQFLRSDADGTFSWAVPTDTNTTYSVGDGGLTEINFTSADNTKLDGIETGATADQTAAEIRSLVGTGNGNFVPAAGTAGHFLKHDGTFGLPSYTVNTNTTYSVGDGGLTEINFTSADNTKLDGIEAGADVNTVTSVASKTGAVSLVKGDVGLGNVDNTADSAKPVSTAQATAIGLKANLASPTFTGTVGGVTATHVGLGNVTNESKATMFSSPTFTGTVAGVTKTHVGLGNVDNTTDAAKPVSTAQATAIGLKANLASPTFTGTVAGVTKAMVGLGSVDNTADSAKPVSTAGTNALNLKLNINGDNVVSGSSQISFNGITDKPTLISGSSQVSISSSQISDVAAFSQSGTYASLRAQATTAGDVGLGNVTNESKATMFTTPTFTGTVSGVTSAHVGLGNVINESKATMFASPTFTGTVGGVTKGHVGLGSVDNTADSAKPVSTAQATAIGLKANLASPTFTGVPISTTPADNDNSTKIATTAFVMREVSDLLGGAPAAFDTLLEISSSLANGNSDVVALTAVVGGKLTKADNLSDLTNTGTARTNLGVAIGTDVQAYNSTLAAVAGGTYSGDDSITTLGTIGTGTWQGTAIADTYIASSATWNTASTDRLKWDGGATGLTASTGRTSLGLVIGTNVQAYNATLAAVAASTYSGDNAITTLGTISTGVWNGTAINATYLDGQSGTNTGDETLSSVNALGITTLGTIATGTWNGSVIASAYLDADTAHLSGTQTFTGAKIFSDTTASSNKTIGAVVVTGGVGIGGALNVGGDVVAYASSDERLKDNIELISNPIEKVQSLKGVTWDWNSNADELQKTLPNVGVIAQDVEKVLPQLVINRDNGFKGVDYAKLTGLLIEAIKDQQKQIDELKSKLS